MTVFWKVLKECKFVEESVDGSGIYFFRGLHRDDVVVSTENKIY